MINYTRKYTNGVRSWFTNDDDKFHRLDGPAVEWHGGGWEWWINGEEIGCKDNEEFLRLVKLKAFW